MKHIWTFDLAAAINDSCRPFIWRDELVVMGHNGPITSIARSSGQKNKQLLDAVPCAFNHAILADEIVVGFALDHGLVTYDLCTGEAVARSTPAHGYFLGNSLFAVNEELFVTHEADRNEFFGSSSTHTIVALSPSLERLWERETEHPTAHILQLGKDRILATDKAGRHLDVYGANDGEWIRSLPGGDRAAIRVDSGNQRLYMRMRGGVVKILASESLVEIGCLNLHGGKLLAHDGRVYISCRGKMVICDQDLQEVLLELDANDPNRDSGIQGKACLVGSRMVCFGSNNQRLWCFDRHTGELLETIDYPDFISATPVFDGERLYVCCLDGTVTCYDASEYID